ncbi:MAG: helix-turn-helix domain-containing protein [Arcanobacterium sp.]|nr:helix-turn-helix domain-containing protein [Arcanobacterium sp.]
MSQEELSKKIFVSRQTISNWENDRTYPDIHSIVLMSGIFHVSVDDFIKGDVEMMQETISENDRARFRALSVALTVAFVAVVITPVPLVRYFSYVGAAFWLVIAAIAVVLAIWVERWKKQHDMQTYREILAFERGEQLDTISKAREEGKRVYQKAALGLSAFVVAVGITALMLHLLS